MGIRRVLPVVALAIGVALAAPAVTLGAPVTIGQTAPTAGSVVMCNQGPTDLFQVFVSGSDTSYVVPAGYTTVTSWSTYAGSGAGQTLKFKVFRPIPGSPGNYTVVAHDGPQALTPDTVNTFPVHIPVQPGDLIGINDQNAPAHNDACIFQTGNAGDSEAVSPGDAADHTNITSAGTTPTYRVNVAASIAALPPAVASVSPAAGPLGGGTHLVIQGHDFTGATSIKFGAKAATTFTVDSDSQITAVTPRGAASGPIDVTVTTQGGTSATSVADRFSYVATCVVPNLKGKTLKKARKLLMAAHCSLGNVKKPKHHHGKLVVKSQSSPTGKVLADGASVSVKLGPKLHHKKH